MDTVQKDVRQYVIDNFLFGRGGDSLKDDDSFLEKGIVDSTGMMEMVAFLEKTYGIKVLDKDLVPDNLDSIGRIVKFVGRKRAGK